MEAPVSKKVPMELVGLGQCRYITGPIRGRETEMCGHKTEQGSWCGYHHDRVMHVKADPSPSESVG